MTDKLSIMKEANRIAHETLENCKKLIIARGELTKKEVETLATFALTRYNVKSAFQGINNFPGIMCISINDEIVHGIPDKSKIHIGDLVSLDFGVIYEGYCSDAAISFVNEQVTKNEFSPANVLVRDTKQALTDAIDSLQITYPKCKVSTVITPIESIANNSGYGIVLNFGGHGIGKHLHESNIYIPNYLKGIVKDKQLNIGDFFTIEPMFTLGTGQTIIAEDGFTVKTKDGSLSAHFEYSLAITNKGIEILN